MNCTTFIPLRLQVVICVIVTLMLAGVARAVDAPPSGWLPAASSAIDNSGTYRTGHGWLAAPIVRKVSPRLPFGGATPTGTSTTGTSTTENPIAESVVQFNREVVLLHLPPIEHDDVDPAPAFKAAALLTEMPVGLAAVDDRVFAVFEPEPLIDPAAPGDLTGRQRRVLVWAAGLNPAGAWDYFPSTGAQSVASLPGKEELLGFVGGPTGPLALIRASGPSSGAGSALRLLTLDDGGWREIALPIEIMTAAARGEFPASASLAAGNHRVFLIVHEANGATPMIFDAASIEPTPDRDGSLEWSARGAARTKETNSSDWCAPDDRLISVARRESTPPRGLPTIILSVPGSAEAIEVQLPGGVAEGDSAAEPTQSEPFAFAALGQNGLGVLTIVRVSQSPSSAVAKSEGESSSRFHVTTMTPAGEIRYDGSPRVRGLVGGFEFRLFSIAAGALMIAVLAFVLRSEAGREVVLPAGVALAPPSTRLAATLIDAIIPVLLASAAFNIPVVELLSFASLARIDRVWPAITLVLVLGAVSSTIAEWMSGQTIGKRLCDCGVLGMRLLRGSAPTEAERTEEAVDPTPAHQLGQIEVGRPTLAQAAIRNAVKWLCPPLVLLVFLDTNWRHAGDALSRTVVVRPIREETDADDSGEE